MTEGRFFAAVPLSLTIGIFITIYTVVYINNGNLLEYKSFVQVRFDTQTSETLPGDRQETLQQIYAMRESKSKSSRFPSVIGIGVKKCGTGALIHFLSQHPMIRPSRVIETFFFSSWYQRGMSYYFRLMPEVTDDVLVMEKTPEYFYNPNVPQRILTELPNAKLILSICNPINRSFSDFVHGQYPKHHDENKTWFADRFDSVVDEYTSQMTALKNDDVEKNAKRASYLCRRNPRAMTCLFSKGMYQAYTEPWLSRFNKSQLLILNGDEWITDPGKLIERVQKFLDVPVLLKQKDFMKTDDGFFCFKRWWNATYNPAYEQNGLVVTSPDGDELFCLNSGKGRTRNGVRSMHNKTYVKLRQLFRFQNYKLFDMIGESFNW